MLLIQRPTTPVPHIVATVRVCTLNAVTMSMSKSSKMLNYINCRMKVTIQDSRQLVGTFMAFDRHMNLVLGDTVEYRRVKAKKGSGEVREEKRVLGLILLRGENVVSLQVEAPAPTAPKTGGVGVGAGRGAPAGRGVGGVPSAAPGVGAAPAGLAGPLAGMGGPAPASMMPQSVAAAARPQAYARPPPMAGMPMGMGPGRGMPPGMIPGRGLPPGMGAPRGLPPGVAPPRGPPM